MTSKEIGQVIAQRLRLAREGAGLSHGQVAKLMQVDKKVIVESESGISDVPTTTLGVFADIYGVDVGWISGIYEDSPDLSDPRLAVVARELKKIKPEDVSQVLQFIASVQERNLEDYLVKEESCYPIDSRGTSHQVPCRCGAD